MGKKVTKTPTGSDGALVCKYLAGDRGAIEVIIERHRLRVHGYILKMVRDSSTADDIFQETIVKAIASIEGGKYVDGGKFISWLLRIAHNQVIDYFRSNKKRRHITSDDVGFDIITMASGDYISNAEDGMIREQTDSQIKLLVETLPAKQREVVVMRHFMNLSFREISELTGVSINTALGRMRYALINLRKTIDHLGLELI